MRSSVVLPPLFILGLAGALAPDLFAQPEGSVQYEVVEQFNPTLPPGMEALREQFPSEIHFQDDLRFDGSTAIVETRLVDSGGGSIQVQVPVPASFMDASAGTHVQQENVFDRLFLVEGPLEPIAWRLTGEASTFLGYEVHQAVADHDGTTVEAWFTPEIAAPVGPRMYHGLPGLILLLTEDGGQRTFTAQEVTLEPLATAIEPPTEGRHATRDELDQLREERLQALEASGSTVIRNGGPY